MKNVPEDKSLIKARVGIILKNPFFATLMMKRRFIANTNIKTACTNGRDIKYNPSYFASLSHEEVMGVICHELMHITCLHHTRREGRDSKLWNKAADYAINPLIVNSGMHLPEGILLSDRFRDMSAEQIYKVLADEQRQEQEQQKQQQQEEQQGAGGGDSDSGQDEEQDENDGQDGQENNPQGDDQEQEEDGQDDTGNDTDDSDGQDDDQSGDDDLGDEDQEGQPEDGQDDQGQPQPNDEWDDDENIGGVDDAPIHSESELNEAEAQAKQELAQAIQIAKQQGKLPAGIERLVNEILQPKIAWQEVLARFLCEIAKNDYSFSKPNPRYAHSGFIMPSLHNEEMGQVVLIVDTSGSIDEALLNRFAGEMQEICSMFNSPITVLYVDAEVQGEPQIIEPDDTFTLEARGGGGTDFRPGFIWLEEQGITPKAVVYFTDLACYDYPEEPDFPVLWAKTGGYHYTAPFGEVVEID